MILSDLLDKFSEVEEDGDGFVVPCPAHDDSHSSLRIALSDKGNLLVKCRVGCDTEAVLTKLGLTMRDLFNVEPGNIRLKTVKEEPMTARDIAALTSYTDKAAKVDTGPAQDYAAKRFGISPDLFGTLGLGYDDGKVNGGALKLSAAAYHDVPRLVVPFRDFSGRVHGLQARALAGKPKAKWSGPVGVTGKYAWFEGNAGWAEVIVTEGPGDALTVLGVGYDALAIRGAALGSSEALADEIATGLKGRKVVVAGDADDAGQRFTKAVSKALSERGVDTYRLTIPQGVGGDLSEWREYSGAAFDRAFIRAVQDSPRYGSDNLTAEEISHELTRMFSDVYNARALLEGIRAQGCDVKYTGSTGFLVYRPLTGVWSVDDQEWVRRQAQGVAETIQRAILAALEPMDARIAGIQDPDTRQQIANLVDQQRRKARDGKLITYVQSTRGIDAMLRELRALEGVAADFADFDTHKSLLAVKNGVVNLETSELTPYSEDTKGLLITKQIGYNYVPGARNPRWERFLDEIFEGNPEFVPFMQRLIGYGITGHTQEQSFTIFWGNTGQNGKSVFVDTVKHIFRGIAQTTNYSTFEQRQGGAASPDIASLKGARLVLAAEGNAGKAMDEAMIKRLTGGDEIKARFLYKDEFGFYPEFLIILMTNHRPRFRGQDGGLWRRVKLVPFTREFKPGMGRDDFLGAKLRGERVPEKAWLPGDDLGAGPEGILAWAVEGAKMWYSEGLAYPEAVADATEEYRKGEDVLSGFYGDKVEVDPEGRIGGKEVWNLYTEWCMEEGLPRNEQWTRKTFWAALEERGAVRKTSGRTVYFRGIRALRPSEKDGTMDPTEQEDPFN